MGVKRGPDGVPVDVPSVMHERSKGGSSKPAARTSLFGDDDATIPAPRGSGAGAEDRTMPPPSRSGGSLFPDDPPTVPAGGKATPAQSESGRRDDPPTVIAGGRAQTAAPAAAAPPVQADPMLDPVVGWLVVVEGPGRGSYVKLGNGQNSIGRGKDQRACIDFGDELISRQNHATVTFDPRGKKFYIQQGSGVNLAYVNDAPVLTVQTLDSGSRISLGNTTLLFIPLCGENFSWN